MLLSRAGVELLALGDVLVCADEAAVGHRQAEDGNDPSIGQLNDLRHLLPEALYAAVDEVSSVDVVVDAICGAGLQDLPQRRATLHLLARQSIDFGIAAVGDDDTLVGVEQADTLWYVVDRHVEARVLRLQVLLMLQDQLARRSSCSAAARCSRRSRMAYTWRSCSRALIGWRVTSTAIGVPVAVLSPVRQWAFAPEGD